MDRFVPHGYLSTEQAIYRLSRAAAPSEWDNLLEGEQEIWNNSILSFRGRFLVEDMLVFLMAAKDKGEDISKSQLRIVLYRDMTMDIIKRLVAGSIIAWSLDKNFRFGRIRSIGWKLPKDAFCASGTAIEALENGLNQQNGNVLRLFFFEPDIEEIEKELRVWSKRVARKITTGRDRKAAAQLLTETHPPGALWPGLREDWDLVRSTDACRNLTREEVDQLRKQINPDFLPTRGRPKKIPEA